MTDEIRPDLVGDGYDAEPLLRASEVGRMLGVAEKNVYGLPIAKVRLSTRRVRWRLQVVRDFILSREEEVA